MKVPIEVFRVATATTDEPGRFVMDAVEIESLGEDGWQVCATDGRVAIAVRGTQETAARCRVRVRADLVQRHLVESESPFAEIEFGDDDVEFTLDNTRVRIPKYEGKYPDIGKVMRMDRNSSPSAVMIDPDRLARAMEIIADLTAPNGVEMVTASHLDPVQFRARREDGLSITVLLMPMRCDDDPNPLEQHQYPEPRA